MANHQLIINRLPVIINQTASDWLIAGRLQPVSSRRRMANSAGFKAFRCTDESSSNRQLILRNQQPCHFESIDNPSTSAPSRSQNRPIIDQLILVIDRSGRHGKLPESSDNLPINGRKLPMTNRQIIVRLFVGIMAIIMTRITSGTQTVLTTA